MSLDYVGMALPSEVVEMFEQLTLRNNNAWAMHQILENAIFGRRQIDLATLTVGCPYRSVKSQCAKGEDRLCHPFAPSNKRARTCYDFAKIERLSNIVVRVEI